MITNKQYKEDINSLLKIIRILYETDARSLDSEEMYQIQTRINAIPDDEDETDEFGYKAIKMPDLTENTKIPQGRSTSFDPNVDLILPEEPHDLGNTLHIPGEDD